MMRRFRDVIRDHIDEAVAIRMPPSPFLRVVRIVSVEADHFAVRAQNGDLICVTYRDISRVVTCAKSRVIGGILQKRTRIFFAIILSQQASHLDMA
jgi:hypothetical protein